MTATGLERLTLALREIDGRVDALFDSVLAALGSYSESARRTPPLQALRQGVRARQAEALYATGRSVAARAAWMGMLRDDPLNLLAAKNVAVCDTFGRESGRELQSWRSYAELLYFYDVVADDPWHHAQPRAGLHREFGHAFAPAVFAVPLPQRDDPAVDPDVLAEFLNSYERVRHFVTHKLLEYLNRLLSFRSPSLVLGVCRAEGDEVREQARQQTLAFIACVEPLLPARVRAAFAGVARRRVEAAFEECRSLRKRTLQSDPQYEEERTRLQKLIDDAWLFQHRLATTIAGTSRLPELVRSARSYWELCRLRRVPLARSPQLSQALRAKHRVRSTPDFLRELRSWAINAYRSKDPDGTVPALLAEEMEDGLSALRAPDSDQELVLKTIHLFVGVAEETRSAAGHERLAQAVEDWLAQRDNLGPSADAQEPLTSADVRLQLDQALVRVFLAPLGGVDKREQIGAGELRDALGELLAAYPKNAFGHLMRIDAFFRLAREASEVHQRDGLVARLRDARREAETVLELTADPGLRKQAEQAISNIDDTLRNTRG